MSEVNQDIREQLKISLLDSVLANIKKKKFGDWKEIAQDDKELQKADLNLYTTIYRNTETSLWCGPKKKSDRDELFGFHEFNISILDVEDSKFGIHVMPLQISNIESGSSRKIKEVFSGFDIPKFDYEPFFQIYLDLRSTSIQLYDEEINRQRELAVREETRMLESLLDRFS